jgi:hypothetical protein
MSKVMEDEKTRRNLHSNSLGSSRHRSISILFEKGYQVMFPLLKYLTHKGFHILIFPKRKLSTRNQYREKNDIGRNLRVNTFLKLTSKFMVSNNRKGPSAILTFSLDILSNTIAGDLTVEMKALDFGSTTTANPIAASNMVIPFVSILTVN